MCKNIKCFCEKWRISDPKRPTPTYIIFGCSPRPAALPTQSAFRRVQLDNGLTVLVQEVHTAPLVSVWCWYGVGSRDEGIGLTGASHWVEHMNFKGTLNIPREEMKGIVERLGGMWNGYTWIDQTTYLETAGRSALDQLLFIEAERMNNSLFDLEECESERTVVISELQGGDNDPEQVLDTELTATAFRAHTYRHPTIGWLHDLQSMTRDDLYAHYRRYYVPSNATLVVVGDVECDDVLRRAERHFGRVPAGPVAATTEGRRAAAAWRAACGARARGDDRVSQVRLSRASGDRPGFLPDARARRRADGREGR